MDEVYGLFRWCFRCWLCLLQDVLPTADWWCENCCQPVNSKGRPQSCEPGRYWGVVSGEDRVLSLLAIEKSKQIHDNVSPRTLFNLFSCCTVCVHVVSVLRWKPQPTQRRDEGQCWTAHRQEGQVASQLLLNRRLVFTLTDFYINDCDFSSRCTLLVDICYYEFCANIFEWLMPSCQDWYIPVCFHFSRLCT